MDHTRADRRRAEIDLSVALLDGDRLALQRLRLHEHDESDEYTVVREELATDANLGPPGKPRDRPVGHNPRESTRISACDVLRHPVSSLGSGGSAAICLGRSRECR